MEADERSGAQRFFSMTKGKQPWKCIWKSRFTSGDLSIKGRQDKAPSDWGHKSLKQN